MHEGRIAGGMAAAAIVLASLTTIFGPSTRPDARPRHIILIVADTLRRDHVSAYDGPVATPNIDRIADGGQVLTNAVSSFHQTTMSMGALFTGRTPSIESAARAQPLHWNGRTWCGLARLAARRDETACVPQNLPTLATGMRRAGYRTIGIVSNELLFRPAGFERGFDTWIEVGGLPAGFAGDAAAEYAATERARAAPRVNAAVRTALDAAPAGAVFLYVHYMDAHDWDLHGSYDTAVAALDRGVGTLLDDLGTRGLLEDAIVVLTADHGESLGERHALGIRTGHHGNPAFDPELLVPLLAAPSLLAQPDQLVRSEDLPGLLLARAGADGPAPSDLAPDEVFLSEPGFQTYRRGRWKSMAARSGPRFVLFDLRADPGETRDVALLYPEIVQEHARRVATLARRLATTAAPPAGLSRDDERRLRHLGYLE